MKKYETEEQRKAAQATSMKRYREKLKLNKLAIAEGKPEPYLFGKNNKKSVEQTETSSVNIGLAGGVLKDQKI